jgi:hypothetical protein
MSEERYKGRQEERLLSRQDKKTKEAKELDVAQKGIKLFFGDKERTFFENSGREITNEVLQESFILYRVDYKKTKTHKLYGEAKKKNYLAPVEVFGRINVETEDPEYLSKGGVTRKGFGKLTAHVYLSHLDDLDITVRRGDYAYHKGNYYEITDDGSANVANEFAFGGDKQFYLTIKAVEVNKDVFFAR